MSGQFEQLYKLRDGVVKHENGQLKLLLANFSNSLQKKDIEARSPLIEDFFRTKIDVKPWRSKEDYRKDNPDFDWSDTENIMNSMGGQFDMPAWALYHLEGKKDKSELNKEINKYCEPFIYQLKGCNIHCPYCFVDDFNKDGKNDNSARFFSIPEIVDEFEKEKEKRKKENLNPVHRIRASGGEPTIAIEQVLELLRELEKRNLSKENDVQLDTNLTTRHFIEELEEKGEIEKNLLEKAGEYKNWGVLCSFKGTDIESYVQNTKAHYGLFYEQFHAFEKLVKAGIDAYPFLYNPNPKTLEGFMKTMAKKFGEEVYLKTWAIPLKLYGPEKERLERMKINPEEYSKNLDENFQKSEEVMRKLNPQYKKQLRVGIPLNVE